MCRLVIRGESLVKSLKWDLCLNLESDNANWTLIEGRFGFLNTLITNQLFEAYLKCPTKCFLKAKGEVGDSNAYSKVFQTWELAYLDKYYERITHDTKQEYVFSPNISENLKTMKWNLGINLPVSTLKLETIIQAIERVSITKRNQPIQLIPIRFTPANKITRNDRLRLAFDSVVLGEILGRKIRLGKIIYGDNFKELKIKTEIFESEVRKIISEINLIQSMDSPPSLALSQHCHECDFRIACKQKAIENDDLSLISSISPKERKKFIDKGISTIANLSYTFRPRRKPKRFIGKSEKYYHSLKALAIRQRKIHVVGSDELKIEGTPVYLDVEGIPDRDFYYLIGVRIKAGNEIVQHSLWAEIQADEKNIWHKFIDILSGINNPILIHYGSFEINLSKTNG